MKKIFFLVIACVLYGASGSAQNSVIPTEQKMISVYNLIDSLNSDYSLMRFESGILNADGGKLTDLTLRRMVSGYKYLVYAYTDSRVQNFSMKIRTPSGDNQKETTTDEHRQTSTGNDYELATVEPSETGTYRIKIESNMNDEGTGRYAIMIWSKEETSEPPPPPPGAGMTYSINNYSVSEWQNGKYGDFGDTTAFSCLFSINSAESVLSWNQQSASGVTKFYIENKDESDNRWVTYSISHTDGRRYKFMIPTASSNNKNYIRVIKVDGNEHNPLTDYHILSQWKTGN